MEKRKFRFSPMAMCIVFILCGIFSILMVCPNQVSAAGEFMVDDYGASSHIYANGNAITLKASSEPNKTLIYLDSNPSTPVTFTELSALGDITNGYDLSKCTIFGGSRVNDKSSAKITMEGGNVASIYGGGKRRKISSSAEVNLKGGTVGSIFTGGFSDTTPNDAAVSSTTLTITGGNVTLSAYGGGSNSPVTGASTVIMSGGTIGKPTLYQALSGGGSHENATVGSTTVTMTGGTINGYLYGGGEGSVNGNTTVTVSGINTNVTRELYGGGEGSVNGNTTVTVSDATIGRWIYGGGSGAVGGNTSVTLNGNVRVGENVYGGGYTGTVKGSTNVTIYGGTINGNFYGGGANVEGSTNVTIYDGTIKGNLYGAGSVNTTVGKDTNITLRGGTVTGIISGGGFLNQSTVNGIKTVRFANGSTVKTPSEVNTIQYEVAFYNGTTLLSSPAPLWVTDGGTATQPMSVPTATGKTFIGWQKADGSAFDFSAVIKAPVKVLSGWSVLPTYAVTYDANGATSGTVPTDASTYTSGATVPLASNIGNLTKASCTFGGWSLAPNGSAIPSYTMCSNNAVLYAVWIVNAPATPTESEVSANKDPNATGGTPTIQTPTPPITDPKTGASVDISGVTFPAGVTSISFSTGVMPAAGTDSKTFNIVTTLIGNDNALGDLKSLVVYDLKLVDQDGNVIKSFTGKVKVRIPVPAGMIGNIHVLWFDEKTGKLQDMGAKVVDGYIEFETDHFSYYAIAQMAGLAAGASVTDNAEPTVQSRMPYAVIAFVLAVGMVAFKQKKAKK